MKVLLVAADAGPEAGPEAGPAARSFARLATLAGLAVEVPDPSRPLAAEIGRVAPDLVATIGDGPAAREALGLGRSRGVATVALLHDLRARDPLAFEAADRVLVPTRLAADYHAEALGIRCEVASSLVDDRAVADPIEPRFLTFVDPSSGNGAYLFARVADELGRARPDIPLLIVGARGSGVTLAGSGIDVFARGNVALMERTAEPRDHWALTRVALLPGLAWDDSPRVAAEALANGIPAVASDRGMRPEVVGGSGVVLPVPDRITAATKELPTADEVAPWVAAVARLWDDAGFYEACRRSARAGASRRAGRGAAEALAGVLRGVQSGASVRAASPPRRSKAVVLVPYFDRIERACEEALRGLEAAGVRVVRSGGCPQVDVARNMLISDAWNGGAESILFVDADIGFDPLDALRLLARPELVVSGVYARKRQKGFASIFADGVGEVVFGPEAPGPYPLRYAAGGFLRIKAEALRRVVDGLRLPACNTAWGRRDWPFFLPMAAEMPDGTHHYLGEDWAFSHRLRQVGITPLADTSIRLWHHGPHAYGWEDAGAATPRHPSYVVEIEGKPPAPG